MKEGVHCVSCRSTETGTAFQTTICGSCGGTPGGRRNDSHPRTGLAALEIPAFPGHLL